MRPSAMLRAIKYFSYWDLPHTFVFERDTRLYVLTSEFDEALDEYPDEYVVFLVSGTQLLSSVSDWSSVEPLPKTILGKIPIRNVHFDTSRRKYVDDGFLSLVK
jgi:hypothetical protein